MTKQNFPNDPAETQIGSQKIIPPCDLSEGLSTCDENYDVANSSYALMELLSLIMRVICSAQYERLTIDISNYAYPHIEIPIPMVCAYLTKLGLVKKSQKIQNIFRPYFHLLNLIGMENCFSGIVSVI